MSQQAKRELLMQVTARYREAERREKAKILDEFVAVTGYARKYAIRVLGHPPDNVAQKQSRKRERQYGEAVQAALEVAWQAANGICAKRLVPFLPSLVKSLERHGHLQLTGEVRSQLLAISPATADRLLAAVRQRGRPQGMTTTSKGKWLKHQVPVRTFADWNEMEPGFLEADLVAHCGTTMAGSFLWSFVLTDIATGWTECLALRQRSQSAIIDGIERVRQWLPFALLGFDTDNGGEFLNHEVVAYCEREEISFTRGRAYKKNDQCFVEQKNGSIVRQLIGYDRYEGEIAYRQLVELYRAIRLYVNFFQPSMKLLKKQRQANKVQRTYASAQTPFQRLLDSNRLPTEKAAHLSQLFERLDPVRLRQQIEMLQDALWRHAVVENSTVETGTPGALSVARRSFDLDACLPLATKEAQLPTGQPTASTVSMPNTPPNRKYRRQPKEPKPRSWRTRADPFEKVSADLYQWFLEKPERTAKSLLQQLQKQSPNCFPDNLLRTLQRRVNIWRTQIVLEFDTQLTIENASLMTHPLPAPLQAIAVGQLCAESGTHD
jgi:hypothetical protein